MARVKWDQIAEKFFEGGCSKGMCFTGYNKSTDKYEVGQAWNGVSGFTDNPSGADEQSSYADNIKYISMRGAENYGGTIKCYWYPDNFRGCLGKKNPKDSNGTAIAGVTVSQQGRESFGFAVTTQVGNDTNGTEAGETLHLVWNATTSPSSKDYSSLNESPSPSELSFEFSANPVDIGENFKPSCNIEICTVGLEEDDDFQTAYTTLKNWLYGTDDTYSLIPDANAPADWASAEGKYYKKNASNEYVEITSGTDTYAKDTYYLKTAGTSAYLPSPAAVIELFGGVLSDVAEG